MVNEHELKPNEYIRCHDTQSLWVYLLHTPDNDALGEKNWSRHDTVPLIGPTQDYNILRVGVKEIKRNDLRQLIKILYNSGLIVNSQGTCFLDSQSPDSKAQYFKLKSQFDWSNFQIINPSTKPDPTVPDDRIFDNSGLLGTEFFYGIVTRTRVKYPSGNFDIGSSEATIKFERTYTKPTEILGLDEDLTPMETKHSSDYLLLPPIVPVTAKNGVFDSDNWWLISVAIRDDWRTDVKSAIYYDPEIRNARTRIGERTIPVPFEVGGAVSHKQKLGIHMIHGVGIRFVFFI